MPRGLVVLLAALAFAVAGCSAAASTTSTGAGPLGAGSSGSGTGFVAGDGSVIVIDAADRVAAPDISGTTLDGSSWTLSSAAGDVAVLNVWASWCAPCRAEAPALQRAWEQLADKGVQFIGLNTRDSMVAANRYVDRFAITYPSLSDPDGAIQLAFHDSLPPQAIPSTIVIDRRGQVAARILGVVDETTLTALVTDIAAEP